MSILQLTELLEKYGLKTTLFIFILFLLISIVKSKWFSKFIGNLTDKVIEKFMRKNNNPIREVTESDITNHDIFIQIDFWRYSRIPTFNFSSEYRTIVFRRYLSIFLSSYKNNLKDFIDDGKYKDMDNAELLSNLLSIINKIIYEYEREMKLSKIPKIVIDKMKSKNNDSIQLIIDLMSGIINSQFYQSEENRLKIYSILNIFLSVLESTISNAEGVCDSINGALKGLSIDDGGKTYKEP